jgi:hypothetical protein
MENIILNKIVENCKIALRNHKEVFSGELKSVQMVDGIIIFELRRTFRQTLHSIVKKCFIMLIHTYNYIYDIDNGNYNIK